MKKTIYLLNIGNYAPEITEITYPFIKKWAEKIGAHIYYINERKFPTWPITYEKLQIYELMKENKDDWAIYIDSDALVYPDMFDPTTTLSEDTVMHFSADFSPVRFTPDEYFQRDGRFIGSGNWFTVASKFCRDLWHPIEDLSPAEAVARCHPISEEARLAKIVPEHLIDDFALSRNIARYGLKFITLCELADNHKLPPADGFLWHTHLSKEENKLAMLKELIEDRKISPN